MTSVSITFNLYEIDTDDLVSELCNRIQRQRTTKGVSEENRKELRTSIIALGNAMAMPPDTSIQIRSLDDKMKYEHLTKVFEKYSTSQIEQLLP